MGKTWLTMTILNNFFLNLSTTATNNNKSIEILSKW